MNVKDKKLTKMLTEASAMIAFSTVLSLLTLLDMPYGGSVTAASMLPMVIIAYRYGVGMGLGAGFTYAVIQQLLGLKNLSYVTGWQSVVAVIMLDYIVAFTIVGLGGVFKGRLGRRSCDLGRSQSAELALGMLLVCILRYLCHTVSGATVWAGLSIPTEAAVVYSLGYNATYMIPETVVNVAAAAWIGDVIDFSKSIPMPKRRHTSDSSKSVTIELLSFCSKLVLAATVIADTLMVFAHLQDPESGKFTFEFIKNVNLAAVIAVTATGAVLIAGMLIAAFILRKKTKECS